jgi:6-phosphogluconolactonase (cycloisomerase 2 family)
VPDRGRPNASLYVAGYGSSPEHGLYRFSLQDDAWSGAQLAAVPALTSLAGHPRLPVVYGTAGTPSTGTVLAWTVGREEASLLSSVAAGGTEPCHLAVDPHGRWLAVANYSSGSVAVWGLADDGSIAGREQLLELTGTGVDPDRQEAAHPHQVVLDGDRAYVPDLGADRIRVYRCDGVPAARLVREHELAVPAGTGPRHLVVLREGVVAVSGELRSTILTGRVRDPDSPWSAAPSTGRTLPPSAAPTRNYPGDITASPDRALAYLANRGHHTVSTFAVGGEAPLLVGELDAGVSWPQHLLLAGDELLVAGRETSNVAALTLVDGVPISSRILFDCPGAAWLLHAGPMDS